MPDQRLAVVSGLHRKATQVASGADGGPLAGGPGGGDNEGMERRVSLLEQAVARIDATLPHLATKADVQAGEMRVVKWTVGVGLAVASLVIAAVGVGVAFTSMMIQTRATAPTAISAPAQAPTAPTAPVE